MNKKIIVTWNLHFLLVFTMGNAFASDLSMPARVNNSIIPAVFASALARGMSVPVFIRYDDVSHEHEKSKQRIADVTLSVKNGGFYINEINIVEGEGGAELSPEIKKLLSTLKERPFNEDNKIIINKDASIYLDTKSFYLEMTVGRKAMSAVVIPRSNILLASTVSKISSILNYTFGSYISKYDSSSNGGNYLTLDSMTSLRENHLNVNGSLYGIGTKNKKEELYRAMYERDYQGKRVALGMVDTWNMQSIASMNALDSSRIFGTSYGNKSNTVIDDNSLTLIPITVFLPAAGEVHVLRQGHLLSIQNFPMGSFEVDTSRLPFGVYDVDIDTIVNGKVVNSRKAQINKAFSRQTSVTGKFVWQVFSGLLKYNRTDYKSHENYKYGQKETWLAGLAFSIAKPWFSGTTIKSTQYAFDQTIVNESELSIAFNDVFSLTQQIIASTDSTLQGISTFNVSIPEGYGSVWVSRKYGRVGDKVPMSKGDYSSFGFNANLNKLISGMGTLSVSRNNDKYNKNSFTNLDYSQSLLSNKYAAVTMNTGLQRYNYSKDYVRNEKYFNLNVSLPLSSWVSAGFSSDNGSLFANSSMHKNIDDGVIKQVGASFSKRIRTNNGSDGYQSNDLISGGYVGYDAKYNEGTVSLSHSSSNTNLNLSSQGNIAWTPNTINLGKGNERSGIVIETDFSDKGKMLAQVNGSNYELTGKSNFINLPPYAEYNIELMNDKNSEDSFEVVNGRRNHVVLYPGNISVIKPEVKQMVTVFGRVRKPDGTVFANVDIHNHIGKAKTDGNGEFAMDVDKRYPIVTLIDKKGRVCEADLDLHGARGAVWVGNITCEPQEKMALVEHGGDNV